MDHKEAGQLWNDNAEVWTKLARAGYDIYRDYLNTPAFLAMLPDVGGLDGLDIGCGEGNNTRLLAERGAKMTGIDISAVFIAYASDSERAQPLGIDYHVASAVQLPFHDATFDFATGFMSFMDIPETDRVFAEAYRVLKPGGFVQFSIEHPCFATPYRRNLRNEAGITYAIEVGDYFRHTDGAISEWLFSTAPPDVKQGLRAFKTPTFHRTLGEWLNMLVDTGFRIERIGEPTPDDRIVKECPAVQDAQVVAYFLHVRVRKDKD